MMNPQAGTSNPENPTKASADLGAPPASSPPAQGGAPKSAPIDEKISPKLQVLIQREKAAIERERAAKALEATAKTRAQELEAREAKIKEFETLKQTNPLKALEMLGLSYGELTQIALADGNVTPDVQIKRVEERLNSLVQTQEERDRLAAEAQETAEKQRHEQTISNFQGEIKNYCKANAGRYELIEYEGKAMHDAIYQLIDGHYNQTLQAALEKAEENGEDPADIRGEVLTIAQAADKVEEQLEKKYLKAKELKKVQALLAPRPVPRVDKPSFQTPTRQTPKTLNNQMSATTQPERALRPKSDQERIAAAIAYARGLRPAA